MDFRRGIVFFLGVFAFICSAQEKPQDDLTIQVNVNLIQIDVTVVDKARKHVPGLTENDFEVFRDGKRQPIKKVLYVSRPPLETTGTAGTGSGTVAGSLVTPQAGAIRAKDVRRTIAIYIDDLSMRAESVYYMRDALRKFVNEQIRAGDIVAIYRSSGGLGLFQQFTTDKRAILAGIEGVRYRSINGVDSLASIQSNPLEDDPDPTIAQMAIEQRQREEINNRTRQDMLTANVLSNAAFVVQGLRELPGRKSMVVFSESMQLNDIPQQMTIQGANAQIPGAQGGSRERSVQAMRSLIDIANRSGVTFYTIDPRGLQVLGFTAMDTPSGNTRRMLGQQMQRETDFQMSQGGMAELASATGGLFFRNTNDLGRALEEAANDLDGYYLIAFQPDAETFVKSKQGGARMHKLEIKVRKPGLKVRYRQNFAGVTDAERMPQNTNPLVSAMISPFRSLEVPIKLTPLYFESDEGPVIRALFFLDTKGLQFSEEPAAADDKEQTPWKKAVFDEMLMLYDQSGKLVDKVVQTQTIRLRKNGYENTMKNGLAQVVDLPVKQPGPYQLRAAILDQATKLTGSSAQFVVIPDVKNKQLAMSDVTIATEAFAKAQATEGTPALRVMRPGEALVYGAYVYNAKGASPSLDVQVILSREGKTVFTGKKTPFRSEGHIEGQPLALTGTLKLGTGLQAGEYVLQVAVRDNLAPKKHQYLVQAADFEVRPK
jgi:VWFA-related protein